MNENYLILHYAVTIWLIVAVVIIARIKVEGWFEYIMSVSIVVFWPAIFPIAALLWIVLALFETAQKIRQRLKDQGLEREFYKWLDEKKGTILPKDET